MGDSIYQTLFMLEVCDATNDKIESIHIQTNKACTYYKDHPYGSVGITTEAAKFLAPVFVEQGWTVTIGDTIPEHAFDIDSFRRLRLNFTCGDIRLWCYNLAAICLPMDLRRQTLTKMTPDVSYADKIVLCRTDRYRNAFIDWKILEPLKDKIVFLGLEKEHKDFCDACFKVDYLKCEDALHMLNVMSGAKTVIANPCGPYALAEQAKISRCLLTPEFLLVDERHMTIGPVNVIPQGGDAYMCGTNDRLRKYVEMMI